MLLRPRLFESGIPELFGVEFGVEFGGDIGAEFLGVDFLDAA